MEGSTRPTDEQRLLDQAAKFRVSSRAERFFTASVWGLSLLVAAFATLGAINIGLRSVDYWRQLSSMLFMWLLLVSQYIAYRRWVVYVRILRQHGVVPSRPSPPA